MMKIEQMRTCGRIFGLLAGMTLLAGTVIAGGVDPREQPVSAPVPAAKVTATPAETAEAVRKARQAAAPEVEQVRVSQPQPFSAPSSSDWLFGTREQGCASLSGVPDAAKRVGSFDSPRDFAFKMQQRGYQAFVMDLSEGRDQVLRVKIPTLELDLTFTRAEACR